MPSVLLVDDNREILEALASLCSMHGYDVATAADAGGAVRALRSRGFDVIVSDYHMPDHDGLWLLQRAVKEQPGARRVLMSIGDVPNLQTHLADGVVQRHFNKASGLMELVDGLIAQKL